ncbi:MAG: hypothetical protein ACRC0Y_12955, partial [Fusobacteriaceae bacterium]
MKLKSMICLLTFLCLSLLSYAEEFTLEQLNELKSLNMITEEDYVILLNELEGAEERESFYNLKVNGAKVSEVYPVIVQENKIYLPLINLFNTIGFKDYAVKSENLIAVLGTEAREVIIKPTDSGVIVEQGDFYIESEKFKELFLRELYTEKENSSLSMRLNFETSAEIEAYLANVRDGIIDAMNTREIIF